MSDILSAARQTFGGQGRSVTLGAIVHQGPRTARLNLSPDGEPPWTDRGGDRGRQDKHAAGSGGAVVRSRCSGLPGGHQGRPLRDGDARRIEAFFGEPEVDLDEHLAGEGYYVAGYDSRETLKPFKQSGKKVSIASAAAGMAAAFEQARRDLDLPETTKLIAVGNSRGASMVALMAVHRELQQNLAGAIAIALTRESRLAVGLPQLKGNHRVVHDASCDLLPGEGMRLTGDGSLSPFLRAHRVPCVPFGGITPRFIQVSYRRGNR